MRALGARVLRLLLDVVAATWRLEIVGGEHADRLHAAGGRLIYAVWHRGLLAPVWHHRTQDITLLVSGHRDGRLLADTARRWGYRIVHGSSTRGGAGGLRGLVRTLERDRSVATTPDGPRGPARRAKPGLLAAARRTGAPILPVAAHARPAFAARSWDGFLVPLPFARVRIVYGPPLRVEAHERSLAGAQDRLEAALDRLTEVACAV